MKIPKSFVPEKDLTNKVKEFLLEKPSSLYDHVKKVYECLENKNIILLYGPPETGKTFTSNKTKEALSKEYDITQIYLQPVDSIVTVTKEVFFQTLDNKIASALSSNKKVYVDIKEIEKFAKSAQEAIDNVFMKYKNNKNVVFVLESCYKYLNFYFQDGPTVDIEFKKNKL